jgi:hypothetical protein
MGYSPAELARNPALQIEAGAKYLSQMLWRFKNIPLALAAYNAGPGPVEKFGGIPPYRETQAYVSRIMSMFTKHEHGGIFDRPHIGIFGEAGPEAFIPLSSRFRKRGIDLWQDVGERLGLGVQKQEHGGNIVSTSIVKAKTGGKDVYLNVTNHINVTGTGGEMPSAEKIADEVAGVITRKVKAIFQNIA